MNDHIKKQHNKTLLLFHLVCPARYRQDVFTHDVAQTLKQICQEIEQRYEIYYIELGTDIDHVHFLIQTVPMMMNRFVQITKSITARELFVRHPEVRKQLWGGKFWTSGYYLNTVGIFGNEDVIKNYVKNQGKHYDQIYRGQLKIFDGIV